MIDVTLRMHDAMPHSHLYSVPYTTTKLSKVVKTHQGHKQDTLHIIIIIICNSNTHQRIHFTTPRDPVHCMWPYTQPRLTCCILHRARH